MKKLTILTLFTMLSHFAFSQKATDDFTGKWKTDDGTTITIKKTNGNIIGLNPDQKQTLYNIRFEDGQWKGTVTNNKTGQTGNCEIYLQGNKLKIIAHKGIFSKTFYWQRL